MNLVTTDVGYIVEKPTRQNMEETGKFLCLHRLFKIEIIIMTVSLKKNIFNELFNNPCGYKFIISAII